MLKARKNQWKGIMEYKTLLLNKTFKSYQGHGTLLKTKVAEKYIINLSNVFSHWSRGLALQQNKVYVSWHKAVWWDASEIWRGICMSARKGGGT